MCFIFHTDDNCQNTCHRCNEEVSADKLDFFYYCIELHLLLFCRYVLCTNNAGTK